MIAWSFVDLKNPTKVVYIILTENLKNIKIQKVSVSGQTIFVASLKDLLIMKKKSNRPKDLLDIESIEKKFLSKIRYKKN